MKIFSPRTLTGSLALAVALALFMPAVQADGREKSVQVRDTVRALLRTHNSLKSIQENRTAVGHEITRAKAGWGPRIDVTARGGYGRLNDSTTRSYDYDHGGIHSSLQAVVAQPIWDGLNTYNRVQEAEATYRSMDWRVLDNANTLALDAIIAHVDVERRHKILDLAETNVAVHEEILEQAKSRESLGADTLADVTQAQSRLSRARSSLTEARSSMRIGEDTYTRLTKMPPQRLAEVGMPSGMFQSWEDVLKAAQKNNPKVLAYLEDIKASNAVREQAKSAFTPNITIEGGPSVSDRDNRKVLRSTDMDVSAVVRWNIFNSGADVAETRAAAARIRQSRKVLYDYFDELKLNVQQTWSEFLSAKEQYQFYTEAVEANLTTLEAYREQFLLNQRTLLDVLDAQNELYNSSTQAATARGNYLIAAYRMKALSGTLLACLKIDEAELKEDPEDPEALHHITLPN